MGSEDVQVVIVGAGPVGMAMAVELGLRGIRCLVVEQRDAGDPFPARTNLTNGRSMSHFRRWGIADAMRDNDPVPEDFARDVTFVTRLNGRLLVNFEGGCQWRERLPISPEVPEWAPQSAIERTLRDRIASLPTVDVRFGATATDFVQDDDGVELRYRSADGEDGRLRVPYLVIADGSRSNLRRKLNVRLIGDTLAYNTAWHFRAPELRDLFKVPLSVFIWFYNEDIYSGTLRVQSADEYTYTVSPLPPGVDGDDWDTIKQMLFRAVGAEFDPQPIDGGAWVTHSRLADRYDYGRVFLAGDTAHLTSPMGGFGMNMGIGDAVDLGWKLAAVLNGWGGRRMLETYSVERRQAEQFIISGSAANQAVLAPQIVQPHMEEDSERGERTREKVVEAIVAEKTREFYSHGAQFGYRYDCSPLIVADGTAAPPLDFSHYAPSARPGCLAPHVWLDDHTSLYDRFGSGYTLLRLDDQVDVEALEDAARSRKVPLAVVDVADPGMRELYETALALIRPDQHVAWRGDELPDDCGWLVDAVRGALDSRPLVDSDEALAPQVMSGGVL